MLIKVQYRALTPHRVEIHESKKSSCSHNLIGYMQWWVSSSSFPTPDVAELTLLQLLVGCGGGGGQQTHGSTAAPAQPLYLWGMTVSHTTPKMTQDLHHPSRHT